MDESPIVVAYTSDHHVNHQAGLCAPVVERERGSHHANKAQRWLWRRWLEFWQLVGETAEQHQATVLAVFGGDAVDLDVHNRSVEYIDRNPAIVHEMALKTLAPGLDLADQVVFIRGTEAHVGKSAAYEELLAKDLDHHLPDPETGTASWYHAYLEVRGVTFDIAHHTSMGRLPHTAPNSANRLAFLTEWEYRKQGQKVPDFVVRSHNHRYADSGRNYGTHALIAPCWSFKSVFAHRIAAPNPQFGGMIWVCRDGKAELEVWLKEPLPKKKTAVQI